MAPSQIQIATSSLQRLLKEEASYYKEQEQQEARIQKLEKQDPATSADSDGNQAFLLKQEVCAYLLYFMLPRHALWRTLLPKMRRVFGTAERTIVPSRV